MEFEGVGGKRGGGKGGRKGEGSSVIQIFRLCLCEKSSN